MKLFNYLKTLSPTFEVMALKDSVERLIRENSELNKPTYEKLTAVFNGSWKFKNSSMSDLDSFIKHGALTLKMPLRNANSLEMILAIADRMEGSLPIVLASIDKVFKGKDVSTVGLTYTKANLLQYVEAAEFFITYTRIYANAMSALELQHMEGNRQRIKGMGPDDLSWLMKERSTFISLMPVFFKKSSEVKGTIANIADMIVDGSVEDEVKIVVGASKVDAFGFTGLPWPISSINRMQQKRAMRDNDKYEEAKVECGAIEYRILLLKERIENGQTDAYLENELEIQEDRLLKYRRNITEMEQDYGFNEM